MTHVKIQYSCSWLQISDFISLFKFLLPNYASVIQLANPSVSWNLHGKFFFFQFLTSSVWVFLFHIFPLVNFTVTFICHNLSFITLWNLQVPNGHNLYSHNGFSSVFHSHSLLVSSLEYKVLYMTNYYFTYWMFIPVATTE